MAKRRAQQVQKGIWQRLTAAPRSLLLSRTLCFHRRGRLWLKALRLGLRLRLLLRLRLPLLHLHEDE